MTRSCQPSPRSLGGILDAPESSLGSLTRRARRLQQIQSVVRALLEAPLAEHVQVARAGPATLVLAVDSPAWASRLRFRATDLLPELSSALDMPQLTSVRVIVCPASVDTSPVPTHRRGVGSASATLLQEVADSLEDEPLARVLRSLANRRRPD